MSSKAEDLTKKIEELKAWALKIPGKVEKANAMPDGPDKLARLKFLTDKQLAKGQKLAALQADLAALQATPAA
jgi:hypothetical protein